MPDTHMGNIDKKRKDVILSIEHKVKFLNKIDNGVSVRHLTQEFGVGTTTRRIHCSSDDQRLIKKKLEKHCIKLKLKIPTPGASFLIDFHKQFVPVARVHCWKAGLDNVCKIVLFLDNCFAHPPAEMLMNTNVFAMYFPPNVTS